MKNEDNDLIERTFAFSVLVVKFIRVLPSSSENDVIKYQLAKAGTSVGANYEEAQAAFSRKDFLSKVSICLREARESNYWLRIIKTVGIRQGQDLDFLLQESEELKRVFGSIVSKMRNEKD